MAAVAFPILSSVSLDDVLHTRIKNLEAQVRSLYECVDLVEIDRGLADSQGRSFPDLSQAVSFKNLQRNPNGTYVLKLKVDLHGYDGLQDWLVERNNYVAQALLYAILRRFDVIEQCFKQAGFALEQIYIQEVDLSRTGVSGRCLVDSAFLANRCDPQQREEVLRNIEILQACLEEVDLSDTQCQFVLQYIDALQSLQSLKLNGCQELAIVNPKRCPSLRLLSLENSSILPATLLLWQSHYFPNLNKGMALAQTVAKVQAVADRQFLRTTADSEMADDGNAPPASGDPLSASFSLASLQQALPPADAAPSTPAVQPLLPIDPVTWEPLAHTALVNKPCGHVLTKQLPECCICREKVERCVTLILNPVDPSTDSAGTALQSGSAAFLRDGCGHFYSAVTLNSLAGRDVDPLKEQIDMLCPGCAAAGVAQQLGQLSKIFFTSDE